MYDRIFSIRWEQQAAPKYRRWRWLCVKLKVVIKCERWDLEVYYRTTPTTCTVLQPAYVGLWAMDDLHDVFCCSLDRYEVAPPNKFHLSQHKTRYFLSQCLRWNRYRKYLISYYAKGDLFWVPPRNALSSIRMLSTNRPCSILRGFVRHESVCRRLGSAISSFLYYNDRIGEISKVSGHSAQRVDSWM